MLVEEKLRNNLMHKLFLIVLKYIPVLITLSYILNTILYWFNIDLSILSNISGMSLCTWLFMYIQTYVFKFCEYHRLLLYYILITDLINIYDYYFVIPISDYQLLSIHTALIGILILLILIVHVKYHKRCSFKNNK